MRPFLAIQRDGHSDAVEANVKVSRPSASLLVRRSIGNPSSGGYWAQGNLNANYGVSQRPRRPVYYGSEKQSGMSEKERKVP